MSSRYDSLFPFVTMDPTDKADPAEWLLPGLLMKGKINGWFGPEKAGKSRLLAWCLVHMYAEGAVEGPPGRRVLGQPSTSPGKLLYVAGEETRQEVIRRLVEFQEEAGIGLDEIPWSELVDFCEAPGMRLDTSAQRKWLMDRISGGKYRCVMIDPLRRVHGAAENSNDEMAPLLNDLRKWTNKLSLTLWILHHTGKLSLEDDESRIATWSRGASDLPAILDWAVYIKRLSKDRMKVTRQGRAPQYEDIILADRGEAGFRKVAEV